MPTEAAPTTAIVRTAVVSIGSVQPSFDVERLYQPCKLLANLCLVSLPSYQAALLKPARYE